MAVSRREISSLVRDLFWDSVFETPIEPYIDLGIDRLNRDRPRVKVDDIIVTSQDVIDNGTILDLPTGFDDARDKILTIENLNDPIDRNLPATYINDWQLYQVDTDTIVIQIFSTYDVGSNFRIKWRTAYTYSDSSSNIPDSLARPIAMITAFYYINVVVGKLAQARREGGDEIGFTAQMANVRELGQSYLTEYEAFIKELAPAPVGVVPASIVESMPSRMRSVSR